MQLVAPSPGRYAVRKHVVIQVNLGVNYIADLKARLAKAKISHGMLAREMGWSASQLSRSFNKDIQPTMATVEKMERAFLAIQERNAKQ